MRMAAHGLTLDETIARLDRKKQEDLESWTAMVRGGCRPVSPRLYGKPDFAILGDKSPDSSAAPNSSSTWHRAIPLFTPATRPSRDLQEHRVPGGCVARGQGGTLGRPHPELCRLETSSRLPNVHVVRYEDLILSRSRRCIGSTSSSGLHASIRFLEWFRRPYPERFLWSTAVDLESGIRKEFDSSRLSSWRSALSEDQVGRIRENPSILEFMIRSNTRRESSLDGPCDDERWRRLFPGYASVEHSHHPPET